MKNDVQFPSMSQLAYSAIRTKALTVNEIVEQSGMDPDYCRVQIGRWLRGDVIRRGAIRDGRMTYTARGAGNLPRFFHGRGRVPEMILQRCKQKWHTSKMLIDATRISASTIRKHLATMVKKRKLEVDYREGGVYWYRVKN